MPMRPSSPFSAVPGIVLVRPVKCVPIALLALIGIGLSSGCSPNTADVAAATRYVLWEPEPAPNRGPDLSPVPRWQFYPYDEDWERWSYPLGNGTIGANVFGRTDIERIQISEKTFANKGLYGRGGLTSAAELFIELGHDDFSDYRRELSLNEAMKRVTYQSGGVRFTREYFTSYPDDVLVVRL